MRRYDLLDALYSVPELPLEKGGYHTEASARWECSKRTN